MTPVNGNFYSHTAFSEVYASEVYASIECLHQIQAYQSIFLPIQYAIDTIPNPIELYNILDVIENFNYQLFDCKNAVDYCENISNLEQLRYLEKQLVVYKLKELKEYYSDVESIQDAIDTIPYYIELYNTLDVIDNFNYQLFDCKNAVGYHENIFTLEQLRYLEQQLVVYKLKELKEYSSEVESIQTAINTIPNPIELYNILGVIENFNYQLFDCKNAVGCHENISTLEQLRYLEQRLVVYKLKELKEYASGVVSIKETIDRIPEGIDISNASRIIEIFNTRIVNCKTAACYNRNIFTKEQVEELEGLLEDCDQSLGQLWHALPIFNKPNLKLITTMRKWLGDIKNLPLLDTVTSLDLTECDIVQLPIEMSYLRNLKELKLSVDERLVLPQWITSLVDMKTLEISYKRQVKFPMSSFKTFLKPNSSANSNLNYIHLIERTN